MTYKHKLVVFHDVVLELTNFSFLNFIASALFNNIELNADVFSQIIRKIMYQQLCIDMDMFNDSKIIEYLDQIRINFKLETPEISLWESPSHFLVNHTFFDEERKVVQIESIERGFCLRMLFHYLDWDFTYNTFIVSNLYPKILLDKKAIHVYYLGILMMNAIRIFGKDESVKKIEEELLDILEWKNECSVVAYLILKQTREDITNEWIKSNEKFIIDSRYKIDYLKEFLLI
jgi:hypothetical protein